jgi:hypothetical protein
MITDTTEHGNSPPAPTLDEVWRLFRETDRKLNALERLFTSQWGKRMGSLVEGDLIGLFNARGIAVERTATRIRGRHGGENYEFDIVAGNGKDVVSVEVKTTLRPDDVKDFLAKMKKAKGWLSEYCDNTLYGAMAISPRMPVASAWLRIRGCL